MNRRGPDATRDHALAELGEARRGVDLGAVAAVGVDAPGPEDLAEGAGARPQNAVDGDLVDRLGPAGDLAADDELGLLGGEAGPRVVRVDQAPALGRRAPVVERVVLREGGAVVEVQPVAATAVEVLF